MKKVVKKSVKKTLSKFLSIPRTCIVSDEKAKEYDERQLRGNFLDYCSLRKNKHEAILKSAQKATIFTINHGKSGDIQNLDLSGYEEAFTRPINLPFKSMVIHFGEKAEYKVGDSHALMFHIQELGDVRYRMTYMKVDPKDQLIHMWTIDFSYGDKIWENAMLRTVVDYINTSKIGEIDEVLRLPIKPLSPKDYLETNKIIYCSDTHDLTKYDSRPVNWLHKWSVRGHWRIVSTFGHDRYGNKIDNGFTWVTDHVKGSGKFVEKIRSFNK